MQSLKQFSAKHLSADLADLLEDIASACCDIGHEVRRVALVGNTGKAGTANVQGEEQQTLDLVANTIFTTALSQNPLIAGLVSEEIEDIIWTKHPLVKDQYMLFFDPLDGSSNIDLNLSVGTIFSVYQKCQNGKQEIFQTGQHQKLAGYALYGPSMMLVISNGHRTDGFTLNEDKGEFLLSHPNITIPQTTHEFAINASRRKHWHRPIAQYIDDCLKGTDGPLGKNYNMRWAASMVADVHRILVKGGVFLYPTDKNNADKGGKLRLMYEANPMAFIVKTAGGSAYSGETAILDSKVTDHHQRIGVILGSAQEVATIQSYFEQEEANGP